MANTNDVSKYCPYCERRLTPLPIDKDKLIPLQCKKCGIVGYKPLKALISNTHVEFCTDEGCGGETIVRRNDKAIKAMAYCLPRTRICLKCGKKTRTGEFVLTEAI